MNSPNRPGFIPPHGHYQELLSYQKAEVVYDLTFNFASVFSGGAIGLLIRWYKPPAPENKISRRAAKHPAAPSRPTSLS